MIYCEILNLVQRNKLLLVIAITETDMKSKIGKEWNKRTLRMILYEIVFSNISLNSLSLSF